MAKRITGSTPKLDGYRMPAEFEPQAGVWMLWPERNDNWRDGAKPAQKAFLDVATAILQFEPVTVCVSPAQYQNARERLPRAVRVVEMASNDAWIRDCGPTFLVNGNGGVRAVDWTFNAWGGLVDGLYFPWDLDDQVAQKVCEIERVDSYRTEGFVLEGGSIHVDGEGTVLTTEMCLLSEGRNPDMDRGTMELLFLYYASVYSSDASWTMSMQELFDYLQNDLLTDARFASFLTDDMRAQITDAQTMLTDAVTQLRGSNYSRLVLTTTLPGESDETSAFIAQLMQDLDAVTTGDYYLIGNSAMVYEMENSFDSELLLITLLTAASIFLVVVFTFRSLVIPALLVLIVQCGVFITVTVVGLQGLEIYYLALLIVECILMGATIDYGILYTSYYREMRESMSVRDALIAAYRGSIHTVLTSGSIMVLVTAVVGKFFGNPTIEQICRTISIGAFSAIILILLFLPGMLALLDRWVLPRDLRRRLYPPKAPKAPKAPKPPKAARASWP